MTQLIFTCSLRFWSILKLWAPVSFTSDLTLTPSVPWALRPLWPLFQVVLSTSGTHQVKGVAKSTQTTKPTSNIHTCTSVTMVTAASWSNNTPQPLYNTTFGVQASFRVGYPNCVISRVKCISYIGKGVLNSQLGSNLDPCYIQTVL